MGTDTQPDRMLKLKQYVVRNFEQFFVLLILLSVACITYLLPYKLAFLNFFYIPILLAASYIGTRQAVLGAIFSLLLVVIYAVLYPAAFTTAMGRPDLYAQIIAWGCFLILSGAVVGYLNQQLKARILEAARLDDELTDQKTLLEKTTRELIEHTENLEKKVAERTASLAKAKEAVQEQKDKVEEALYSTMDAAVVKLMIEKRLRTEKRRLSVLFCDLKGFTHYAEQHQPEVVIAELNAFVAEMEETLLQYRAHIDKYMGDGIMAEFGAPIDYARHALLAVAAGLKLQERLSAGRYPWPMRVGIATGELIVGLIGNKRQSYTALGDVVNLASRIEELCEPGAVTIDEETRREVQYFFDLERRALVSPAGAGAGEVAQRISDVLAQLETQPDDIALLKKAGRLMREAGELAAASQHYKRAMELDPQDTEAKLAFAEVALQAEHAAEVRIRGRVRPVHLYEVRGFKNPLRDASRIPPHLYNQHRQAIDKLVPFPDDLVLPVECLDGSVGHARMVGFLAGVIARHLDLPEKEQQDIIEAGYLANIGKTIVPHHVLNRRGSLTREETADMTAIRRESVRKLRTMGYTSPALFDIIMNYQENFDGTGPLGRAGTDIHIGARIIRVVDAYAALASWRPYRDRWDAQAAYHEVLKSARQGRFDPGLATTLGELLQFEETARRAG